MPRAQRSTAEPWNESLGVLRASTLIDRRACALPLGWAVEGGSGLFGDLRRPARLGVEVWFGESVSPCRARYGTRCFLNASGCSRDLLASLARHGREFGDSRYVFV